MTINGSAGHYIPDQRQVEAEQRAREESDYWRSVAMNREPEEVIKVSDERMYYGKQHGKNIVVFEIPERNEQEGRA